MKTGVAYGIVASSKTRVRCVFCGVHIPKATKCIEQHTNGVKHRENIELMNENAIALISDALYCRPCMINIPEDYSITKHIEMEDHANWIAAIDDLTDGEFISIDSYLCSETDNVHCEVCSMNIVCTLQNIQNHVNEFSHRANIMERLKPLNAVFCSDDNEDAWCKLCDVYIVNTVQSILEHIDDDEEHIQLLARLEDIAEVHNLNIDSYLMNEHENNAFCNKCNIEIVCNVENIEEHINSNSHLNNIIVY
ncbi:uncharacterized protein LOC114252762 [Bombyx mandarina]|uniref:Uncharacterized protein n=2 Tax=Bombyx TaxID=7090 RepID=A0A8R1WHN1_BOMMO|nr:uncharacterized protein LOC101743937 [Bombyx mori]XP_028043190.1 uncharacterized protein LOC114252762 [Bombyx mandarina]